MSAIAVLSDGQRSRSIGKTGRFGQMRTSEPEGKLLPRKEGTRVHVLAARPGPRFFLGRLRCL
jgi:hypothetical protein